MKSLEFVAESLCVRCQVERGAKVRVVVLFVSASVSKQEADPGFGNRFACKILTLNNFKKRSKPNFSLVQEPGSWVPLACSEEKITETNQVYGAVYSQNTPKHKLVSIAVLQ